MLLCSKVSFLLLTGCLLLLTLIAHLLTHSPLSASQVETNQFMEQYVYFKSASLRPLNLLKVFWKKVLTCGRWTRGARVSSRSLWAGRSHGTNSAWISFHSLWNNQNNIKSNQIYSLYNVIDIKFFKGDTQFWACKGIFWWEKRHELKQKIISFE